MIHSPYAGGAYAGGLEGCKPPQTPPLRKVSDSLKREVQTTRISFGYPSRMLAHALANI
jgi:hypothetical protein